MDEGSPLPPKKNGSARTSRKSKRRNVIRYMDWSGEQESVKSSPTGVQEQAQDVEDGHGSSPEFVGEAMIPVASESAPGKPIILDHQMEDASSDQCANAPKLISPIDLPIPTTSEYTEEDYELRQAHEEQKADDWPSETMRPNAQNLRYGGYPAQPAPQNRNTPLGSGRLQNTTKLGAAEFLASRDVQWKADAFLNLLGNGTNWGFGAPANGAPGLPSVQPSQTGAGTSSFAQRVGGSQPAAPLDLSYVYDSTCIACCNLEAPRHMSFKALDPG